MSPPDSIGTRNGSAAAAASASSSGRRWIAQRAEREHDEPAAAAASSSAGRSRSGSNCGVDQMFATSRTGVSTSAPSIAAARARGEPASSTTAASSAATMTPAVCASSPRVVMAAIIGVRSSVQMRSSSSSELGDRAGSPRTPACPVRITRPLPKRAATITERSPSCVAAAAATASLPPRTSTRLLVGRDVVELARGAGEQVDLVDDVDERHRRRRAHDRPQAGAEQVALRRQRRRDRPQPRGVCVTLRCSELRAERQQPCRPPRTKRAQRARRRGRRASARRRR